MHVHAHVCIYISPLSLSLPQYSIDFTSLSSFSIFFLSLSDNIKKWLSGPHEGPTKFLKIEVLSSREAASVSVDGSIVCI